MNSRPEIVLTAEQRATYERDGVVHLKGVISQETLSALTECFTQAMEDFKRDNKPLTFSEKLGIKAGLQEKTLVGLLGRSRVQKLVESGLEKRIDAMEGERLDLTALAEAVGEKRSLQDAKPTGGKFLVITSTRAMYPAMRELIDTCELPALAASLYQSPYVSYYEDQMFYKEPGSATRTAFHQDAPYFHVSGEQCASFWIPLDVVDRSNGAMGYVPGSHKSETIYRPNVFVSQDAVAGSEGEQLPDIEGNESKYGVVYFDAEPGDVIVHHYRTIHGSTGNTTTHRMRRAVAIRYCGADIRYQRRISAPPKSHKNIFKDGDLLDREPLPKVWPL